MSRVKRSLVIGLAITAVILGLETWSLGVSKCDCGWFAVWRYCGRKGGDTTITKFDDGTWRCGVTCDGGITRYSFWCSLNGEIGEPE